MIRLLFLNPSEKLVTGEYNDGDMVMCMCDAEDEGFTIQLPDCKNLDQVTFKFVKIDTSGNTVTLSARTDLNQKLSGEDTQVLPYQGYLLIYNSDGSTGYW